MKNFEAQVVEKKGDYARVELKGFLDAHTVEEFDKAMRTIMEEGIKRVALGMEGLSYISSPGIGSIVSFTQRCKKENGELVLFCPNKKIYEILEVLGFSSIFRIADTTDQIKEILALEQK